MRNAVPVAEAFAAAIDLARPVDGTETVPVMAAAGRVLAADLVAAGPYPAFDHAAFDGYALRAADCGAGDAVLPCPLRVVPGSRPAVLPPGAAARIFTGAPIPAGADAVVMQEACSPGSDGQGRPTVRIGAIVQAGQNLRRAGEDMSPGQTILRAGCLLDARHLAAAAAADLGSLPVVRRIRVGFLSCGNELVAAGAAAPAGAAAARDSNRPMLAALLARPWIAPLDLGIQPDDPDRLADALAQAADQVDLLITSGGMSVGDTDHLPATVAALGGGWAALQVAMKPGKPLGLGRLRGSVLLGLPGNPYAAFVGALLFGGLVLRRLSGQPAQRPAGRAGPAAPRPAGRPAVLAAQVPPRSGRTDFLPVAVEPGTGGTGGLPRLRPLGPGGSARLAPLLAADGLAELAVDRRAAGPGTEVRFHAFSDLL